MLRNTVFERIASRPSRLIAVWGLTSLLTLLLLIGWLWETINHWGLPGLASVPWLFSGSTGLLFVVSAALRRAELAARREKQRKVRRAITLGLAAGLVFLELQATTLAGFLTALPGVNPDSTATEASKGSLAFLFVVATLHALHVLTGFFWLLLTTLRAYAGRYDHEYHFGLTACGWYWHGLFIIWIVILFAGTVSQLL